MTKNEQKMAHLSHKLEGCLLKKNISRHNPTLSQMAL